MATGDNNIESGDANRCVPPAQSVCRYRVVTTLNITMNRMGRRLEENARTYAGEGSVAVRGRREGVNPRVSFRGHTIGIPRKVTKITFGIIYCIHFFPHIMLKY